MRMDEHIKRLIQKHTVEAARMSGQEALERYEMAYTQARELGNAFTIRACAANLGAMYVSLGKKEEAQMGLKYLSEAIPPEGVSDCVSNGDLYFNIGLGCEVVGLLERAHSNMKRAWEEYVSERDNVAMEIAALKKLIQISQTREKYEDAVQWCHHLEDRYRHAKRPVDQLTIMQQRVTLQKTKGDEGLSEGLEECGQLINDIQKQGKITVGMLIQMAVMLAHFKQPQAAREYLEKANELLGVEHSGSLEKAVVLQNLGTLCNYLDDWEVSLTYHRQAAAIYQRYATQQPDPSSPIQPMAALRCQGHCIANHAYALAKLEDVDEARVLFNKALELAAQCNDQDTKWQMEEALGAVHFRLACHDLDLPSPRIANLRVRLPPSRLKHLEKSLEWYKMALMDLANAPKGLAMVQDRVLEKYTLVKNFKANVIVAQAGQMAQLYTLPATQTTNHVEGAQETTAEIITEESPENVGKSSTDEEEDEDEEGEEEEESEEEESGESSSSEEEDEEGLPLGKTLRTPAEEDEDREQVKALYQAQLSDGGTLPQQRVKADVHAQQHVSSSAESASSSSEEEDDSEDESDDESDDKEEKKGNRPPVPAESPPETLMPSGTYETPKTPTEMQINELYGSPTNSRPRPGLHGSTNYADIDFDTTAKKKSGEWVSRPERRARPNFFISTSDDEENGETARHRARAGAQRDEGHDGDYEPMEIRSSSPQGRPAHRPRQEEEAVGFEMGGSYLSRGEEKPQKDSKTCSVM